ncbi:MAG: hypothetical protein AAGE96_05530 [Cyanobacteria bacterium P01_G01_bin.19]
MNTATLTQVEALELVAIELDLDAVLTEELETGYSSDVNNMF